MPITFCFCTRCCDHRSSWDEKQKSTCPLHRSAYSFFGQIVTRPLYDMSQRMLPLVDLVFKHIFLTFCFNIDLGHTEVCDGWSIHRQLRWQRSDCDVSLCFSSKPSITYSEISRPRSTGQSSQHWILYLPDSLRSAREQSPLFGIRGVITGAT